MKTLIVYASQYGTTEKCARLLAGALAGGADLHDLKSGAAPGLSGYGAVVVGGSVRAGVLLKPTKRFAQENADTLLQKRLGLFVCNATPGGADEYLQQNYPAPLLAHAAAKASFGGEFVTEKMGFFAKKIVQAVGGKSGNPPPLIDEEAIRAFAARMDAE